MREEQALANPGWHPRPRKLNTEQSCFWKRNNIQRKLHDLEALRPLKPARQRKEIPGGRR